MCVAAVAAACSSSDDSSSGGDPDRDAVDRGAVEQLFSSEAAAVLDGADLVQGAQFGKCPILGGVSFQALIDSAGLDVEVESDSDRGFVSGAHDFIHYSCSVDTEDGQVSLLASFTPFLDASEWLRDRGRIPDADVDYELITEADGFAADSLVRGSDDERAWPVWITNGLTVSARFDGSFDDHLDLLAAAVDAIADAAGTSDGEPDGLDGDGIDRDALLDAFDDIQRPDEHGLGVRLIDDACPFLSDSSFDGVADVLDWPDIRFDQATSNAGAYAVECSFGTGEDRRHLSIGFGRPLTVHEYVRQLGLPTAETNAAAEPLDVSLPGLTGGAFTGTGPGALVGYIDNGFRLIVSTADGDDPEAVVTTVVSAVLDELGLS